MIVKNLESSLVWNPTKSALYQKREKIFDRALILGIVAMVIFLIACWSQRSAYEEIRRNFLWVAIFIFVFILAVLAIRVLWLEVSLTDEKPWTISDRNKEGLTRLQAANKYWMERGLDGEYIGQGDLSSRGVWTPKASGAGAGGVYGVWTHPTGLRVRRVSYSRLCLDDRSIGFHRTEYLELSLDGRGKDNDTTVLALTRDRDQEPVCSVVDDFDRVLLWPVLRAFEDELGSFTQNDIESAAYQIRMAILNAGRMAKINA